MFPKGVVQTMTFLTDPETGEQMSFPEVVVSLLVEEHDRTKEDAEHLVVTYQDVMVNGMMGGMNYRATAIALEMKEADDG